MRIAEFHIDGFGRLADLSFTDVPPGLSVIVGDNEAGKTTLLEFLRFILFGLPSSQQKESYPPLKGGRKGGRIALLDRQSNRIIVERFGGKGIGPLTVTFPDGSQGGEEEFRQTIGSATRDLYNNVFAFSLSELQTFDSLQMESVRDAIYSAGIGIGRRTITEVVQTLKKQSGDLFAPRGSRPIMNKILSHIDALNAQIKGHEKDQDEYGRIQFQLETSETNIRKLDSELSKARRRLERVQLLQQAGEDWIALGDSQNQLATLPEIESFPEDGVRRLDALNTECRGFHDQLTEANSARDSAKTDLAAVDVDDVLLSAAEGVRQLDRRMESFERSQQALTSLQTERERAEQKLDGALRDLGDEWDDAKLGEFDLSVPMRERMNTCRRAFEEAKRATRECLLQWEQRRKQHEEAIEFEDEARSDLKQLAPVSERLDVEGIEKLQHGRQSYEDLRTKLPSAEKECEVHTKHFLDTLRGIGPNWTEDRLKAFDTSLVVQEKISAHQQRLSDLRSKHQEATRRGEDAHEAVHDAQADATRAEEVLLDLLDPGTKDEAGLTELRRTLRALRSQLYEARQLKADLANLEERKHDLDERIQRAAGFPGWVVPTVLLVGTAGLVGFGVGRGDWISGGIVFALAVMLGILLGLARRASAAAAEGKRATVNAKVAELQRRIVSLRQDIAAADAKALAQARSVQMESIPDGPAVDEAEGVVERQLEALQRRRPAELRRDEASRSVAKARDALSQADERATETTARLGEAQTEWQQWLARAELPETLAPEDASNLLARLDTARERLKAIEEERGRVSRMRTAIADYGQQVRSVASASGLDQGAPDDAGGAADFLAARLEEHEERVHAREEASRRLDEASKQTARAQSTAAGAEQLHREAQGAEEQGERQWTDLLKEVGLRSSLAVESAPQMLQAIERARDQLSRVQEFRERARVTQESLDACRGDVRSVSSAAGRPEPADGEVTPVVAALAADLDRAEEDRRHAENQRAKIKDSENRMDQLERQIELRQREINELLEAANATDEEVFRRRAADFQTQRVLGEQIRDVQTRLRQLAGSGDALERLKAELKQATPESLRTEVNELKEAVEGNEQERTDAADGRGRLKAQLERLESSEELSWLRVKEKACRAEFESSAEEWSALRIAEHLIDRAREKYERERRPDVLKDAERYFSRFTKGNYTEILAPADRDQVVVLTSDGSTKEIHQLSRGTAEQLYLSLRFGFVQEFVGRSEPLPLVFDDILVNFDPDRAHATAEAILDLSKSLQILFFTCHPPTVELMKDVDASIPVYALKDGSLARVGSEY